MPLQLQLRVSPLWFHGFVGGGGGRGGGCGLKNVPAQSAMHMLFLRSDTAVGRQKPLQECLACAVLAVDLSCWRCVLRCLCSALQGGLGPDGPIGLGRKRGCVCVRVSQTANAAQPLPWLVLAVFICLCLVFAKQTQMEVALGSGHTPAVPVAARAGKQVAAEMAFLAQKAERREMGTAGGGRGGYFFAAFEASL